jgi:hypothetical protein
MHRLRTIWPNGFPEQDDDAHHNEYTGKAQEQESGRLHIGHTKASDDKARAPDKYKDGRR